MCKRFDLTYVRERAATLGFTVKESQGTYPFLLERGGGIRAQYFDDLTSLYLSFADEVPQ